MLASDSMRCSVISVLAMFKLRFFLIFGSVYSLLDTSLHSKSFNHQFTILTECNSKRVIVTLFHCKMYNFSCHLPAIFFNFIKLISISFGALLYNCDTIFQKILSFCRGVYGMWANYCSKLWNYLLRSNVLW